MKVEVIKKFKDKNTGKLYKPGDVIEVTKKRYAEIQRVGNLVQEVNTKGDETDESAETADAEE